MIAEKEKEYGHIKKPAPHAEHRKDQGNKEDNNWYEYAFHLFRKTDPIQAKNSRNA